MRIPPSATDDYRCERELRTQGQARYTCAGTIGRILRVRSQGVNESSGAEAPKSTEPPGLVTKCHRWSSGPVRIGLIVPISVVPCRNLRPMLVCTARLTAF